MTKVLGLITARGGSKGIPKKNIEHVGGKPLIAWTIEAALKSNVFDRVVVSTDNNEIAGVAQKWGAEVPFIRPVRLSKDDSPHVDVLIHAINWLQEKEDYLPEFLMLLQPTSPLRTSEDIDKSFELAVDRKADCVISVQEALSHPYSVMQVAEDQKLSEFLMSSEDARRRGIEPLARIKSFATRGVDPSIMGTGPIPASRAALEKAGWTVDDLDLIEANEAFAAQACAVNKEMGWDTQKVNVNGGSIALGHPIGASGARVLITLLHEMKKRDAKKGLTTLCIGGGMGVAMCLERD